LTLTQVAHYSKIMPAMIEFASYATNYLAETARIAQTIDAGAIVRMVEILQATRAAGKRLFILGVGGSAGNASHAVNDFRKIAKIEAYAPTDNVSELTAWTNDVGWHAVFIEWLKTSRLGAGDAVLVFSVGGGSATVSRNLVLAMEYAKEVDAKLLSVVSRNGGRARELSDVSVLVPVVSEERITPHAEGWQGVVWHCVVNALALSGSGAAKCP
jgi:D-sedoheptulose 7-phosphate isomerase